MAGGARERSRGLPISPLRPRPWSRAPYNPSPPTWKPLPTRLTSLGIARPLSSADTPTPQPRHASPYLAACMQASTRSEHREVLSSWAITSQSPPTPGKSTAASVAVMGERAGEREREAKLDHLVTHLAGGCPVPAPLLPEDRVTHRSTPVHDPGDTAAAASAPPVTTQVLEWRRLLVPFAGLNDREPPFAPAAEAAARQQSSFPASETAAAARAASTSAGGFPGADFRRSRLMRVPREGSSSEYGSVKDLRRGIDESRSAAAEELPPSSDAAADDIAPNDAVRDAAS